MKLRPYQKDAVDFMLDNRAAAIFADPGLGKTLCVLVYLARLRKAGQLKGALIVAPLRPMQATWPHEIAKWYKRAPSVGVLHGPKKADVLRERHDLYLTTPDSTAWLHGQLTGGVPAPFDVLVVDESGYFQSHASKRFKALSKLLGAFDRRVILNGTPTPRSIAQLWSQLYLLDKGAALGKNITAFRRRWFHRAGFEGYSWEPNRGAEGEIARAAAPLVLRVETAGNVDIPERIYNRIHVELPPAARKIYNSVERNMFAELDDGGALVASTRSVAYLACRQMASGATYEYKPDLEGPPPKDRPVVHVHNAKKDALLGLVQELNGKPLFIAYQFRHELARLREWFRDPPNLGLKVSASEVARTVRRWNAGEIPIMLGHPSSMSHGLNLQEGPGRDVCFFALTSDLERYEQTIKRFHRFGASGAVRIHLLIAKRTIDEALLIAITRRDTSQKGILEALKTYREENVA